MDMYYRIKSLSFTYQFFLRDLSYSDVLVCCNFSFQLQIDFNLHANSMDPDQTALSDRVQTVCNRDFKNRTLVVKGSENVKYRVTVTPQNMGLVTRKPVFGVSHKARFKPVSSATETS